MVNGGYLVLFCLLGGDGAERAIPTAALDAWRTQAEVLRTGLKGVYRYEKLRPQGLPDDHEFQDFQERAEFGVNAQGSFVKRSRDEQTEKIVARNARSIFQAVRNTRQSPYVLTSQFHLPEHHQRSPQQPPNQDEMIADEWRRFVCGAFEFGGYALADILTMSGPVLESVIEDPDRRVCQIRIRPVASNTKRVVEFELEMDRAWRPANTIEYADWGRIESTFRYRSWGSFSIPESLQVVTYDDAGTVASHEQWTMLAIEELAPDTQLPLEPADYGLTDAVVKYEAIDGALFGRRGPISWLVWLNLATAGLVIVWYVRYRRTKRVDTDHREPRAPT
jgi:hypothetical protein